jgi:HD-GYP domain-containing protein (c-di-GMP phosphodiesterase class II)
MISSGAVYNQHHEMIDGSAYPRKLKGDSMLIEAEIICVAGVF